MCELRERVWRKSKRDGSSKESKDLLGQTPKGRLAAPCATERMRWLIGPVYHTLATCSDGLSFEQCGHDSPGVPILA
jgi:hypothetical protein